MAPPSGSKSAHSGAKGGRRFTSVRTIVACSDSPCVAVSVNVSVSPSTSIVPPLGSPRDERPGAVGCAQADARARGRRRPVRCAVRGRGHGLERQEVSAGAVAGRIEDADGVRVVGGERARLALAGAGLVTVARRYRRARRVDDRPAHVGELAGDRGGDDRDADDLAGVRGERRRVDLLRPVERPAHGLAAVDVDRDVGRAGRAREPYEERHDGQGGSGRRFMGGRSRSGERAVRRWNFTVNRKPCPPRARRRGCRSGCAVAVRRRCRRRPRRVDIALESRARPTIGRGKGASDAYDPVCGMEVDANDAPATAKFEGETYYSAPTTATRSSWTARRTSSRTRCRPTRADPRTRGASAPRVVAADGRGSDAGRAARRKGGHGDDCGGARGRAGIAAIAIALLARRLLRRPGMHLDGKVALAHRRLARPRVPRRARARPRGLGSPSARAMPMSWRRPPPS